MKTSLISFVGINDKGTVINGKKTEGAIITALQERKFNQLHLLWNPTITEDKNFYRIANHVKETAVKNKYFKAEDIYLHSFDCKNVTDHNEIYPKLLEFCKSLPKGIEYTTAIASGTPAMQVCWILMAESGDFKIKLIRSNEPRFGKPLTSEVKLGTGLPKIKRLEKENTRMLNVIKKNLLPVEINTKKLKVEIGGQVLKLTNIQFCYYYYFLKRADYQKPNLEVINNNPGDEFRNTIVKLYKDFFPGYEKSRTTATSFHSNVSKINSSVHKLLDNEVSEKFYQILSEDPRGRKTYSINLKPQQIRIK